MITIQSRRLIPPPQQRQPGFNSINREHGKAMPIKHYRLGYEEPICNILTNGPFRDSDSCHADYSPELTALKKVRNSGGTTKQTMSNAEYLKSRSKTYEQKTQHFGISEDARKKNLYRAAGSGNILDANGNYKSRESCTTWKPTNLYYNQDGAVSNSTNINKIKYNTIQKHAKTIMSAFDKSVANAYAYSGRAEAPFTNKSKMQTTMAGMFRRKGSRQSCDVCK
tara:strand:+ start:18197 stop:18868 length:672 start_codon:yes stop_codon:yes gene_type:complete